MDPVYLMKKECLRRGYSFQTVKTYCECVKRFFRVCREEPRRITKKDIQDYVDGFVEGGCSGSTINVNLSALRFLMQEILNKKIMIKIRYSKRPKVLPVVLSKEEIGRLIGAVENPKHKLMVKFLYSAGLRVSELVMLRVGDLELDRNFGWVRMGKGRKDRLFIFAGTLKEELKEYVGRLGFDSYVFRGRKGHITQRTVQQIIKRAQRKAGISKNVHPHTLRHSFATHLIENGCGVSSVQKLLGHSSISTTQHYVKVSTRDIRNIKNPLDN